jgi:hypothetical protein
MEPLSLALALLALAGIIAFVAAPLVRRSPAAAAAAEGSLHLLERRDRALAALRELEFDHRTGKITDADYRALLGPLRSEAAEALQAAGAGGGPR